MTPDYLECAEYDVERGYHMGVYLCRGQPIYAAKRIQQRTEVAPLSEHEAQRLLEEKLMQREYAALQKEKENEQKTRNVMAQFRLLSND